MKQLSLIMVLLTAFSCTHNEPERAAGGHDMKGGGHTVVLPDQIQWKDAPPSLPAGAKAVVLEGDPAKVGYFAMRLQLPDGYQIQPHTHPNWERVTILSGTLHLGEGEKFDKGAAKKLPAGSYSFMGPGMKHFAWAEGTTVIQITTMGPWGIKYVNEGDDPRNKK